MANSPEDERRTRRDSLRLRGFDYTSRRVYFITVVTAERRKVVLDKRLAAATGRVDVYYSATCART